MSFTYHPNTNEMLDDSRSGSKNHRTAVFIDLTATAAPAYLGDRVKRLCESFRPPSTGMMVDLYGVDGTRIIRIDEGTTQITSYASAQPDFQFPASSLTRWAREQGYQMVLFALPAGYGLE
jgi:hypothetical protein